MKTFVGKVVSDKMEKTSVVEVTRRMVHPLYQKGVKRSKRYKVHDELGVAEGNWVKIAETRPISRDKRFKIVEVIKK